MRRLEAGPSGWRGADNCATPRGFLPAARRGRKRVRWQCHGRKRTPNGTAAQAAVFPGARQALNGMAEGLSSADLMAPRIGPGFPAPRQRWVTNCAPTGVAVEQASNTACGTPRFRRSRAFLPLAVASRGATARGSGSSQDGQRDPAFRAPLNQGDRSFDEGVSRADTRTGSAELYSAGCLKIETRC